MAKQERRVRVSFKATKIVSKPAKVSFQTRDGKEVVFKKKTDVPKSVQVSFLAKRKK